MEPKLDESTIISSHPIPMATKVSGLVGKRSSQKRDLALQVANNIFASFRYAWAGVMYSFTTQRNFRIHCAVGTTAICLGAYLRIPPVEMAIISIVCSLVLTLELLNTAIESVVDLTVEQTYHELAKIAKDCAAGAVLISALASLMVAAWLLLPRIYVLFFNHPAL
jgi:diacylglycerol kinase (ATP)